MSWTPGPWSVSAVRLTSPPRIGSDTRLLSVGPESDRLALVFFDMATARGQADAHLIAAAPELYEALSLLTKFFDMSGQAISVRWDNIHPEDRVDIVKAAQAAAAKARGE